MTRSDWRTCKGVGLSPTPGRACPGRLAYLVMAAPETSADLHDNFRRQADGLKEIYKPLHKNSCTMRSGLCIHSTTLS